MLINKRLSSGGYASVEDVLRRALEAQDARKAGSMRSSLTSPLQVVAVGAREKKYAGPLPDSHGSVAFIVQSRNGSRVLAGFAPRRGVAILRHRYGVARATTILLYERRTALGMCTPHRPRRLRAMSVATG